MHIANPSLAIAHLQDMRELLDEAMSAAWPCPARYRRTLPANLSALLSTCATFAASRRWPGSRLALTCATDSTGGHFVI